MAKTFGGFAQIFGGTVSSSRSNILATPQSDYDFVPDQVELRNFLNNFAKLFGKELKLPNVEDANYMQLYRENVLDVLGKTVEDYNKLVPDKFEVSLLNAVIEQFNSTFNLNLSKLYEKASEKERIAVFDNLKKSVLRIFSTFRGNFKDNAAALSFFTQEVKKNVDEMIVFLNNTSNFYENMNGNSVTFDKRTLVAFFNMYKKALEDLKAQSFVIGNSSPAVVGKQTMIGQYETIERLIKKIQSDETINAQSSLLDSINLAHAILVVKDISKANSLKIEDFISRIKGFFTDSNGNENIDINDAITQIVDTWVSGNQMESENSRRILMAALLPLSSSNNFQNDIEVFLKELEKKKEESVISGGITLQLTQDKYLKKIAAQIDLIIRKFTNNTSSSFTKISALLNNIFEKLNKNNSELRFNVDELLNSLEGIGNIFETIQDILFINTSRDANENDAGLYNVDAAFNKFFRELEYFKQPDLTFILSDVNEIIQNAEFAKNELKTIGSKFRDIFKSSQPENIDILNITTPFKMHLNKVRLLIKKINLMISYNIGFIKQSIRIKTIFKENQTTLLEKKNSYFAMLRDYTTNLIREREQTRRTTFKHLLDDRKKMKNFSVCYDLYSQYEELPYNILYAVENILYFSNMVMVDVISDITQFLEIIMNLKLSGELEKNLIKTNSCCIFSSEGDCNKWNSDISAEKDDGLFDKIDHATIKDKFETAKNIITVNNNIDFLLSNVYNILNTIPESEMKKYGNEIPPKKEIKSLLQTFFALFALFTYIEIKDEIIEKKVNPDVIFVTKRIKINNDTTKVIKIHEKDFDMEKSVDLLKYVLDIYINIDKENFNVVQVNGFKGEITKIRELLIEDDETKIVKFVKKNYKMIYEYIDFNLDEVEKSVSKGLFVDNELYMNKDPVKGGSLKDDTKYKHLLLVNNSLLSLTQHISNVFEIYKVFIPIKESKMKSLNLNKNNLNTASTLILGGSADEKVEIIPECVELYMRLPILCELYYDIFIKKNNYDDEKTILSFINLYTANTNNLLYLLLINLLKMNEEEIKNKKNEIKIFDKINKNIFFTKFHITYEKDTDFEKQIKEFFKKTYNYEYNGDESNEIKDEYHNFVKNYMNSGSLIPLYDDKIVKKIIKYCNDLYINANKNVNKAIDNFINSSTSMIILLKSKEKIKLVSQTSDLNFTNNNDSFVEDEDQILLDDGESLKTLNWEIFKSKNTNKTIEMEDFNISMQEINTAFISYFENVLTVNSSKDDDKIMKQIIKSCKAKITQTNDENEKLIHVKSLFNDTFWLVDTLYQYYLYDDLCLFPFVVLNFMFVYLFKIVYLMKVVENDNFPENANTESDSTITQSKIIYMHTLLNYIFKNDSLIKMNISGVKTINFNFDEYFNILKNIYEYLIENMTIMYNYENLIGEINNIRESINNTEIEIVNLDNSRSYVNENLETYYKSILALINSGEYERNFSSLYLISGQRKMYNSLFNSNSMFYYNKFFNSSIKNIGDEIKKIIEKKNGFLFTTPNFTVIRGADMFGKKVLSYIEINSFNGLAESLIIKFNISLFYLLQLSTNKYTKNIYSVIWKYLIIENNSILNYEIGDAVDTFSLDGNSIVNVKNNIFLIRFLVDTFRLALTSITEKKTPLSINYPTNLVFVEDISTFSQNKNEMSVNLSYYKNLFKDMYEQADKIIEILTTIKNPKVNYYIIYLGNLKINLEKIDKGISDAIINFSFNNKYYEPTLNFINDYKIKYNNKTPYMSLLPLTIPLMENILYENNNKNLTYKTGCNVIYGKYTNNVEIEFLNNNINSHNENNLNKISIDQITNTNDNIFKALRFMKSNSIASKIKTKTEYGEILNKFEDKIITKIDSFLEKLKDSKGTESSEEIKILLKNLADSLKSSNNDDIKKLVEKIDITTPLKEISKMLEEVKKVVLQNLPEYTEQKDDLNEILKLLEAEYTYILSQFILPIRTLEREKLKVSQDLTNLSGEKVNTEIITGTGNYFKNHILPKIDSFLSKFDELIKTSIVKKDLLVNNKLLKINFYYYTILEIKQLFVVFVRYLDAYHFVTDEFTSLYGEFEDEINFRKLKTWFESIYFIDSKNLFYFDHERYKKLLKYNIELENSFYSDFKVLEKSIKDFPQNGNVIEFLEQKILKLNSKYVTNVSNLFETPDDVVDKFDELEKEYNAEKTKLTNKFSSKFSYLDEFKNEFNVLRKEFTDFKRNFLTITDVFLTEYDNLFVTLGALIDTFGTFKTNTDKIKAIDTTGISTIALPTTPIALDKVKEFKEAVTKNKGSIETLKRHLTTLNAIDIQSLTMSSAEQTQYDTLFPNALNAVGLMSEFNTEKDTLKKLKNDKVDEINNLIKDLDQNNKDIEALLPKESPPDTSAIDFTKIINFYWKFFLGSDPDASKLKEINDNMNLLGLRKTTMENFISTDVNTHDKIKETYEKSKDKNLSAIINVLLNDLVDDIKSEENIEIFNYLLAKKKGEAVKNIIEKTVKKNNNAKVYNILLIEIKKKSDSIVTGGKFGYTEENINSLVEKISHKIISLATDVSDNNNKLIIKILKNIFIKNSFKTFTILESLQIKKQILKATEGVNKQIVNLLKTNKESNLLSIFILNSLQGISTLDMNNILEKTVFEQFVNERINDIKNLKQDAILPKKLLDEYNAILDNREKLNINRGANFIKLDTKLPAKSGDYIVFDFMCEKMYVFLKYSVSSETNLDSMMDYINNGYRRKILFHFKSLMSYLDEIKLLNNDDIEMLNNLNIYIFSDIRNDRDKALDELRETKFGDEIYVKSEKIEKKYLDEFKKCFKIEFNVSKFKDDHTEAKKILDSLKNKTNLSLTTQYNKELYGLQEKSIENELYIEKLLNPNITELKQKFEELTEKINNSTKFEEKKKLINERELVIYKLRFFDEEIKFEVKEVEDYDKLLKDLKPTFSIGNFINSLKDNKLFKQLEGLESHDISDKERDKIYEILKHILRRPELDFNSIRDNFEAELLDSGEYIHQIKTIFFEGGIPDGASGDLKRLISEWKEIRGKPSTKPDEMDGETEEQRTKRLEMEKQKELEMEKQKELERKQKELERKQKEEDEAKKKQQEAEEAKTREINTIEEKFKSGKFDEQFLNEKGGSVKDERLKEILDEPNKFTTDESKKVNFESVGNVYIRCLIKMLIIKDMFGETVSTDKTKESIDSSLEKENLVLNVETLEESFAARDISYFNYVDLKDKISGNAKYKHIIDMIDLSRKDKKVIIVGLKTDDEELEKLIEGVNKLLISGGAMMGEDDFLNSFCYPNDDVLLNFTPYGKEKINSLAKKFEKKNIFELNTSLNEIYKILLSFIKLPKPEQNLITNDLNAESIFKSILLKKIKKSNITSKGNYLLLHQEIFKSYVEEESKDKFNQPHKNNESVSANDLNKFSGNMSEIYYSTGESDFSYYLRIIKTLKSKGFKTEKFTYSKYMTFNENINKEFSKAEEEDSFSDFYDKYVEPKSLGGGSVYNDAYDLKKNLKLTIRYEMFPYFNINNNFYNKFILNHNKHNGKEQSNFRAIIQRVNLNDIIRAPINLPNLLMEVPYTYVNSYSAMMRVTYARIFNKIQMLDLDYLLLDKEKNFHFTFLNLMEMLSVIFKKLILTRSKYAAFGLEALSGEYEEE